MTETAQELAIRQTGSITNYDPEYGLQMIAVAEAGERHWRRAKDATRLVKAIETKLKAQADYVVWRDSVVLPPAKRPTGSNQHQRRALISQRKSVLPAGDPGHLVAHRWRKHLCTKVDGRTQKDPSKLATAIADASKRAEQLCEQVRPDFNCHGLGNHSVEFGSPRKVVEVARSLMGGIIDLDPCSSPVFQRTIRATKFFTKEQDGLSREWHGRCWINAPFSQPDIAKFASKAISEFVSGRMIAAMFLSHAYTSSAWFQELAALAPFCIIRGRIRFNGPDGRETASTPTIGQALFYLGPRVSDFIEKFDPAFGTVVGRLGDRR
jgi:hypothetical protein